MKSFVNPFADIALAFFDSGFNSFFCCNIFYLIVKICFYKTINITYVAKFSCFDLGAKFPDVNLLNSGVVKHLT